MGRTRRRFSEEFKREGVRLAYESGRRLTDVAREFEVRPGLIRRWRQSFSGGEPGQELAIDGRELRRIQCEFLQMREERPDVTCV